MRVLLEFEHFCLLIFKFTAGLIRIRVLLEGESYLRIYGMYVAHHPTLIYSATLLLTCWETTLKCRAL